MAVVPSDYWITLKIESVFENPGKLWQGVQGRQECPFGDLNVGEVLFSNYAKGSASSMVPVQAKDLTSSGSCKLILNGEGRGELVLILSTTRKTLDERKLDKNACIQMDIRFADFDVEDFVKDFFSTDKKELLLQSVQQYEIKKLDSYRFEKFFPKAHIKEFSTNSQSGVQFSRFYNVLVVLKATLSTTVSDAKIEKIWMKDQQVAGEKLLAEGLVSDFKIEASNGKKFPCHKSYLVGKSTVFAGMMNANMTEVNSNTLKMEDTSPDAVEGLLTYLYTGSLKKVMSNMSVIFEMLQLAHKYQIKDLEIVCDDVLQSADSKLFDAVTAFELYEFCGNVTELQSLQKKAVSVLKDNGKKYGESRELQVLINSIGSSGQRQMAFAKWISESVQR